MKPHTITGVKRPAQFKNKFEDFHYRHATCPRQWATLKNIVVGRSGFFSLSSIGDGGEGVNFKLIH